MNCTQIFLFLKQVSLIIKSEMSQQDKRYSYTVKKILKYIDWIFENYGILLLMKF